MSNSYLYQMLSKYTNPMRHPIIYENIDWEESVRPALNELIILAGQVSTKDAKNLLLVFLEIVYVKGVEYGRQEKDLV